MNHGRRAFALAALAAVSAVAGCATSSTPRPALSQLNYTRTFDLVVAAMNDQKLDVDTQDRRHGHIVGERERSDQRVVVDDLEARFVAFEANKIEAHRHAIRVQHHDVAQ